MARVSQGFVFPLGSVAFSVAVLGAVGTAWIDEPLEVRPVLPVTAEPSGASHPEPPGSAGVQVVEAPLVLRAPMAVAANGGAIPPPSAEHAPPVAVAYQFMAPVYARPSRRSLLVGRVRRGTALKSPLPVGKSCGKGSWYRVGPEGFVCTSDGFHFRARDPFFVDQKLPALDQNVPYAYAEVTRPGAPRFMRLPSAEDLANVEEGMKNGEPPALAAVDRYMDGEFFVAVDRHEQHEDRGFVRTVRGRYVHEEDVRLVEPSTLVGEELTGDGLPMAFVPAGEGAPLYRFGAAGNAREVGRAEPYARIRWTDRRTVGGVEYVVSSEGLALRRDDVRIAAPIEPPADVPAGARWVHVDLDEQVLVAYEGDEPRYATLVASGKPGWDTPTGLHRIVNKLAVFTMQGDDPREGFYEVEDVPWTMFYDRGYALHGAYWHDAFGSPRSHGCTNLAPADARYLYAFTTPEVPDGWQGRLHAKGSWVYLTRRDGRSPSHGQSNSATTGA